ncbi:hypothetical protein ACSSVY_002010 [Roseovarius sp. MBR-51]
MTDIILFLRRITQTTTANEGLRYSNVVSYRRSKWFIAQGFLVTSSYSI